MTPHTEGLLSISMFQGFSFKMNTSNVFFASSAYFRSEDRAEAKFVRLRKLYEGPMFEIQLLFIQAALPVFTTFQSISAA